MQSIFMRRRACFLLKSLFGFITFEVSESSIHIHDLWVDIDYRFEGYGSKLVQRVIDEHKPMGLNF